MPSLSAFGLLAASVVAQPQPAELLGPSRPLRDAPLAFIESSSGLERPRWDGGRTQLALADLNLDGHPDLLSVGDHGSPYINTNMHGVSVWFGDGAGNWLSYQNGAFGYGGVTVGDVNNDGLPDIGYGIHHAYSGSDFGDQLLEVALGDGTGRNWTPWDDGLATHGQSWGMFGSAFADVNLDGFLDLASVSFGSGDGFHVYLSDGVGSWTRSFGFLGGNSTMDLHAGDVNNDGVPDFAAAHQNGTVWIGDGAGGYALSDTGLPPDSTLGRRGVHLGDVTGDGFDDLSWVNQHGGLEVWAQAPATARWVPFSGDLPPTGDWEVTRLVDMNVDGHTDLVAFGEGRAAIFLGDSNGEWRFETTFTVPYPGEYSAFVVGDADHSGYPDIGIVSEQGGLFSRRNKLQFFRETLRPTRLWIEATAPPRHRTIRIGSVWFIDWVAATPAGSQATIDIELSLDGPDGPWMTLVVDAPNTGRYQTNIDQLTPSGNAFIRLTARTPQQAYTDVHGPLTLLP
ncbi:MAG: FG-GAP repeat domain-containing protein [Phycisphaerales bacterium]